jgi:hypothetical protein
MPFSARVISAVLVTLATLVGIGCSAARMNQTTPDIPPESRPAEGVAANQRALWGMWDIHLDLAELTADIRPLRHAHAHYDATALLLPPACDDCIQIVVNSFDPDTRILDIDVTLRNPTGLSARDVRGILYADDAGHKLLNPDDWTKLFDIPGGGTLNPFKAFAKSEEHRVFIPSAEHAENYRIYIPWPWPGDTSYAVDASWPGNCREPYEITNFWHGPIYSSNGSSANIFVDVHDWQDDVSKVALVAPGITGQDFTVFTHYIEDIWTLELTNNTGAAPGEHEVRIIATSADSGDLALYDFATITIYAAPPKGWARTWGATSWTDNDWSGGVAVDNSGNAYIIGSFKGTTDFDPGPGVDEHSSDPEYYPDVFLSKFDSNGDFQWVSTWGGLWDDLGSGVDVSDSGGLYVTGEFGHIVDLDPGPAGEPYIADGWEDIFLSKFSLDGTW